MTSYPVGNKTSLSRKPYIPDKKLQWNAIRKSWSLFQNPSWKIAWSAPLRRTMTSYSACNITLLPRKPYIAHKKLLWNAIRNSWPLFQNQSWKNRVKRPLAEKSRWRHIWLAIKPRYLGNHASQIKSYYGSLSWSLSNCFYKKQQILIKKTYQFINVVNGVNRSHKTANNFFSFDSVCWLECMYRSTRRHYKSIL